jgi:hypothetical protein
MLIWEMIKRLIKLYLWLIFSNTYLLAKNLQSHDQTCVHQIFQEIQTILKSFFDFQSPEKFGRL